MALNKFLYVTAALLVLFVAFHDVEAGPGDVNGACVNGACTLTATDVCDTNRVPAVCKKKTTVACSDGQCVAGSSCTNTSVCSQCSMNADPGTTDGLCDPKANYIRGSCSGSCIPANSECNATSSKCQCKTGYRPAYSDYSCTIDSGYNGGSCATGTAYTVGTCTKNANTVCNAVNGGICVCKPRYIGAIVSDCAVEDGYNGGPCTTTTANTQGTCTKNANTVCNAVTSGTCVCKDGYTGSPTTDCDITTTTTTLDPPTTTTTTVAPGDLNVACTAARTCRAADDACDTNRASSRCKRRIGRRCREGDCVAGSTCINGICSSCSPTTTLNSATGLCVPKPNYVGGSCTSSSCLSANSECSASTSTCQCMANYENAFHDYYSCVAPGDLNVACTPARTCNTADDACDTNRASSRCKRRAGRGGCKEGDCVAGSTCINGACSPCTSTSTPNAGTGLCDPKPNYIGGSCSSTSCVSANSECSASTSTCQCKANYVNDYNDHYSCVGTTPTTLPPTTTAAPGDLNLACSPNGTCRSNDDACDTNRASSQCKRKISGNCKEGDCVAGSTCKNGVCSLCSNTTTPNAGTGLCDPKDNYIGGACTNGSCVPANSECSSATRKCQCKLNYGNGFADYYSCSGASMATMSGLLVIALFVVTKAVLPVTTNNRSP